MLRIIIPDTKEKIQRQIKALEWQLQHDTNDKDRRIHEEALNSLRMALK